MRNEKSYINSIGLIAILFAISFFKDDITPDYLNTSNAIFLHTTNSRFFSLFTNPAFWLLSLGYSACFVYIPFLILQKSTTKKYALYIAYLLLAIALILYILILLNIGKIDTAIIPKINRFYHSPILTLFFLAAYTVNEKIKL